MHHMAFFLLFGLMQLVSARAAQSESDLHFTRFALTGLLAGFGFMQNMNLDLLFCLMQLVSVRAAQSESDLHFTRFALTGLLTGFGVSTGAGFSAFGFRQNMPLFSMVTQLVPVRVEQSASDAQVVNMLPPGFLPPPCGFLPPTPCGFLPPPRAGLRAPPWRAPRVDTASPQTSAKTKREAFMFERNGWF